MNCTYSYVNNTCEDVSIFHDVIMKAIENGGVFEDDFSDIFALVKTPDGSDAEYALYLY